MTKPTNAELDADGGVSMHKLLTELRKTTLDGLGMPAGSFSFALAWMRKGHHVRRRAYPQVTYWLEGADTENPTIICSLDVDNDWTVFSKEELLATDWEAVP